MAYLASLCEENGVNYRFLVTKVLAGNKKSSKRLCRRFYAFGRFPDCQSETYRDLPYPKVLLRLPRNRNNSYGKVFGHIAEFGNIDHQIIEPSRPKAKQKHQIILMFDLGDLRKEFSSN